MKRSPARLAALAVVVLLVTACRGDGSSSEATGGTVELSFGDDRQVLTTPPQAPATPSGDTAPATTAEASAAPTAATTPPPTAAPTVPPTTLPAVPRTSCTQVIHVGDSTSVSLISPSFIADPEQRVDAQYRRVGALDARTEIDGALSTTETLDGQTNAFDRVTNIKAGGYEGCWVFALGGNDTANVAKGGGSRTQRIERMMSAIGDDPVMWVNVKTRRSSGYYGNENMLLWNEALREMLPRYPNMRVFDWAAVVQDAWFQDDAIHYTSDGSVLRAALIANALAAEFPV